MMAVADKVFREQCEFFYSLYKLDLFPTETDDDWVRLVEVRTSYIVRKLNKFAFKAMEQQLIYGTTDVPTGTNK